MTKNYLRSFQAIAEPSQSRQQSQLRKPIPVYSCLIARFLLFSVISCLLMRLLATVRETHYTWKNARFLPKSSLGFFVLEN